MAVGCKCLLCVSKEYGRVAEQFIWLYITIITRRLPRPEKQVTRLEVLGNEARYYRPAHQYDLLARPSSAELSEATATEAIAMLDFVGLGKNNRTFPKVVLFPASVHTGSKLTFLLFALCELASSMAASIARSLHHD